MFAAGATKKIWVGAYMSLNTAVAAGENLFVGSQDSAGTDRLIIGARGSSSTTNFVAHGDTGGAIDSTIALDTNKHLHQFWRDGATGNYKIDTNATVQGDVRPSTTSAPVAKVVNASVNSRTMTVVWAAWAAERE